MAVLPWQSYSMEDISILREEVGSVLSFRLMKFGNLVIIDPDLVKGFLPEKESFEPDEGLAREIGLKVRADLVIWGSLTRIGKNLSLDARLLEVGKEMPFASFFIQAEGTEDLFARMDELAKEMIIEVSGGWVVARVNIRGNLRIESTAIKLKIKSKEGDLYCPEVVQEDIKNIYQMGYFKDVRVEARELPEGKELIFIVQEKPSIKEIVILGNEEIATEKIREAMDIEPHSLFDLNSIKANVEKIESLYRERGFYLAEVGYEIKDLEKDEPKIIFKIKENEKILIKKIAFDISGLSAVRKRKRFSWFGLSGIYRKIKGYMGVEPSPDAPFNEMDLKDLMETKEKGLFSWITSSGIYKRGALENDLQRISAFYYNHGYLDHRIGEPEIDLGEDGIHITIPIEEGAQFRVSKVDIAGDLISPREELLKNLRTTSGNIFTQGFLGKDISSLTDIYGDQGYAFVDISPRTRMDRENQTVDIVLNIQKKKKAYIEDVTIVGNTKTRDKIIRRELAVSEGDVFSASKLRKSKEKVNKLGYFEEVNLTTQMGSRDDKLKLGVEVKERPTGSFSFGGGYSSVDDLVGMVQLSQENLFGKGIKFNLAAQLGLEGSRYILGVTEPWLFDTPVSGRVDLFSWEREYDDFDQETQGGGFGFGFPFRENIRLNLGYRFERGEISAVAWDASWEMIEEAERGKTSTSGITASIARDSRNDLFAPTRGNNSSLSLEFAGLGGDNRFVKFVASSAWYFPVWKDTTIMVRGKAGYAPTFSDKKLPVFERFFLGGLESIKGFEDRDVGPKIKKYSGGELIDTDIIGGDKELLFNVEYLFPLIKGAGMRGILFFDAGSSFGKIKDVTVRDYEEYDYDFNLKTSVGIGVNWRSPMGPLRVYWGLNLNAEDDEDSSNFAFSMGTMF